LGGSRRPGRGSRRSRSYVAAKLAQLAFGQSQALRVVKGIQPADCRSDGAFSGRQVGLGQFNQPFGQVMGFQHPIRGDGVNPLNRSAKV